MDSVTLKVGAGDVSLRPTFQALHDVEEALDASIEAIYEGHRASSLKVIELAQIVVIGMKAAGAPADIHDVIKHIFTAQAKTDHAWRTKIAEYLLALAWAPDTRVKKLESEWSEEARTAPVSDAEGFLASLQSVLDGSQASSGDPHPGNIGL